MFRPLDAMFKLASAFALVMMAVPALAQHSDVEFDYDNNQIVFHGAQSSSLDASWLYEGEFPIDGLSQNFTTDPGFASEVAEGLGVNPGDDIFINVLLSPSLGGALQYHDGVGFTDTTANISLRDNLPTPTVLAASAGGVTGGDSLFLQTASGTGDVHSHIAFTLSNGAAQGAYGLLLDLETSANGISNSLPFWVVFNHGLDEPTFEDIVVPAFQGTSIPEPSTTVLLGIAAAFLGARRRRQA